MVGEGKRAGPRLLAIESASAPAGAAGDTIAGGTQRGGSSLIGVDGHLAQFPRVLAKVKELVRRGLLTYGATEPWFREVSSYASPEGHEWGSRAHRIVAKQLAPILTEILSAPTGRNPETAAALGSGPAARPRQ